jgi:hypothetical protein
VSRRLTPESRAVPGPEVWQVFRDDAKRLLGGLEKSVAF